MIQRQFHSKIDSTIQQTKYRIQGQFFQRQIQPLNGQIGFNTYSIQRQIEPLNLQRGFNVNSI